MTSHAETPDPAQVRQALAEIRSLQDRLERRLTWLEGVQAPASPGHWSPALLHWPAAQSVWQRPATGAVLAPGARFFSPYRSGWLQLIQQPQARHGGAACQLVVNWADVDAEWCSLVFDLRPLLQGAGPGRARLEIQAEAGLAQAAGLFLKCCWKTTAGKLQERTTELRDGQPLALVIEHEDLDPARLAGLDLHLVVKPVGRGSCTLRHLGARLIDAAPAAPSGAHDLFEAIE